MSPWLDGLRPMDIAPKIFEISKKKDCSVRKALTDDLWISQVDMANGISAGHIQEFTILWEKLDGITLDQATNDTIIWKLTERGQTAVCVPFVAKSRSQRRISYSNADSRLQFGML